MLETLFLTEEPSSLKSWVNNKYVRRIDLTSHLRLKIASHALFFSVHGTISQMSFKYGVSRTFIYTLRNHLSASIDPLFGAIAVKSSKESAFLSCLSVILHLRLVGRCSLEAISVMLTNFGLPYHSIGFISEHLQHLGSLLGNQIDWKGSVVCASDELFFNGHCPILISVDVSSRAILRIDKLKSLTKLEWERHWRSLKAGGIVFEKLLTDEGSVLQSARLSSLSDTPWQPDTFHAVSHRMGVFDQRLCKQVEKAIEYQNGRENRYYSTKTAEMEQKIYRQWLKAGQDAAQSLELYDQFKFLYGCIQEQFTVISSKDASIRSRSFAEQEVKTALEYLDKLSITGLKEVLNDVKRILPQLFNFLDAAKKGIAELAEIVEPEALPFWLRAWQKQKTAYKIKKNYQMQKRLRLQAKQDLECLQDFYQFKEIEAFEALNNTIFRALDNACVQSSAAVENVNSVIRPFLNQARDQVSQESLNLIMFYHNNRTFTRGKRKGKTPIECLTGQKSGKSWVELILDKLKK
jgi:hypothetical protein